MGTRVRVTTVAGAATLLCAASALGGGLSAFAAPSTVSTPAPTAAAPAPMLVGTCGGTVRGQSGQRVGVRLASLPVIDLGEVPDSGSRTYDATPALREAMGPLAPQACTLTAEPLLAGVGPVAKVIEPAAAPLRGVVSQVPGLGQAAAPAPAAPPSAAAAGQPQPEAAPPPALAAPAPGHFYGPVTPSDFPFTIGTFNSGMPRFNYADLLTLGRLDPGRGSLGRLSAGVLTADLFGTPQVSNGSNGGLGKQSAAANDVAAAGRATALPASGVERVALPILVAVLMVAGVSAALLRSWVLSRR